MRRKRPNAAVQPPKDIRLDQVSHWSTDTNKQSQCKMPGYIPGKNVQNVIYLYVLVKEKTIFLNIIHHKKNDFNVFF